MKLTFLLNNALIIIFTLDGKCKFTNVAFVIDSTKLVKPIEFDAQHALQVLSRLIGKLKLGGYSSSWRGRVYHDNNDCLKNRTLNVTEHFGPVHGPGIIRKAILKLKHFPSVDTFDISCAETLLFREYNGKQDVGLIIAPYDTIKDKFDKHGMYGFYVYHERIRKKLILIHDDNEIEQKTIDIVDILAGFTCPTPTPSIEITPTPTITSTPGSSHTTSSTTSHYTPALTTTSSVVSMSTTGPTSVSTTQVTSTSTIYPSTSLRVVTTSAPTPGMSLEIKASVGLLAQLKMSHFDILLK